VLEQSVLTNHFTTRRVACMLKSLFHMRRDTPTWSGLPYYAAVRTFPDDIAVWPGPDHRYFFPLWAPPGS
jgi:hypothetical protein